MNHIFFAGLVVFLMATLGWLTVQSGRILQHYVPTSNLILSPPDNLVRVALVMICIGVGLTLGPGAAQLGWQSDSLPADLLVGVGVGAVLSAALLWAGAAAIGRWGPEIYDNRLLRAIVPAGRREWLLVALALAPAALGEELLFRSLPLGGLSWLVPPAVLMWPLALVFGLLHTAQGPWGVFGSAMLGLVFSVLFLWTGNIWTPFAAHYVLNLAELTIAMRQGVRPLRLDAKKAAVAPAPKTPVAGPE